MSNGHCASHEDGNACNGTLYCDKAKHRCKPNPATKVTCPTAGDTACRRNVCQPKSGKCALSAKPEGAACDDGDMCTPNERCHGGQCSGTWAPSMYPAQSACECKKKKHCAGKNADRCQGEMYCEKASGRCRLNAAKAPTCQHDERCVPKTGKCVKK